MNHQSRCLRHELRIKDHSLIRNSSGFTLLEMLLAVTLLTLVIGAVYANFSIGLKSYKKGMTRGDLFQDARGGLRVLESDLERMLPGQDAAYSKESISFSTVTQGKESRLEKTIYSISSGILSRQVSGQGAQKDGAAGSSSVALIKGIKKAGFEYNDGAEWVEELKDKEKVPVGVRIKMELETDGEDGAFQTAYMLPAVKKKEDAKKQVK